MPLHILRDTNASQSLLLCCLPGGLRLATGKWITIRGVGNRPVSILLHRVNIKLNLVSGTIIVGVVNKLLMRGVSMLLAGGSRENQFAKAKVTSCAVSRTQERVMNNEREKERERSDGLVDLSQTFLNHDVSSQGLNKIEKGCGVGNDLASSIFLQRKNLIAE